MCYNKGTKKEKEYINNAFRQSNRKVWLWTPNHNLGGKNYRNILQREVNKMYEVQLEKVIKAEKEKNEVMHEIAEFLTKQINELCNTGIDIHEEENIDLILSGFTWDEEDQMLKAQFDY